MFRKLFVLFIGTLISLAAHAGASAHFFPRLRPLFVGLNESALSPAARKDLAQARFDFVRARHGEKPRFAAFTGMDADLHARVYQGSGYRLMIVHEEAPHSYFVGPAIELDGRLTGGAPIHYSEVDEITE
jgi:hypothetical protein